MATWRLPLELFDELRHRDGGQGRDLDRAPRPQLDGDARDRLVVDGLHDRNEVIVPEDGVLVHDLRAHRLDLFVDFLDALRTALDRLAALVGERAEEDVGSHVSASLPYVWTADAQT